MVIQFLALLVVTIASLLKAIELLSIQGFEYEQIVKLSDPLVQLAAVSAIFISSRTGAGGGLATLVMFFLLTLVWTFSLGLLGVQF